MKKTRFISYLALCAIIAALAFVAGQISEKTPRISPRATKQATAVPAPASPKPAPKRKILYYRDPMDPSIVSKHPGKAPCGMDLVPVYADQAPAHETAAAASPKPSGKRKILYWRAPMDPNYISPKPGKSPMGMDLVPVYADEVTSGEIHVSPTVVQEIGVTTTEASSGPFSKTIRTYGTSTWNETTMAALNTKMDGWIEKLYANVSGQPVRKGQPLIRIYSPQLVSAQEEYLAAVDNAKALSSSPLRAMAGAAQKLPQAARMRLKLWDISDAQIDQLRRTRKVSKTLTLYAPISGIVTRLDVVQGAYVTAGRNLMEVASIDPVWVNAYVYEDQVPMVKKGMKATVAFDSIPGQSFAGRVDYVYPYLEGKSRTTQVRIVLPNPGEHILPQMYGTVKLSSPVSDDSVQIPADAVIRASSTDSVVFIALGDGRFAGRKVVLGPEGNDGMVMVKAGLQAGERIVTSAQFLLDSESRLNEAVQAMINNGGQSK
ncbi:MAG: efflux RND transporter periplasmic adaptor subunit [Syntrophobacteraceae bacterium]|nr:efflux RND transporter periplasmic adaptor subunit [Syntrophobacteraceae bacterium]